VLQRQASPKHVGGGGGGDGDGEPGVSHVVGNDFCRCAWNNLAFAVALRNAYVAPLDRNIKTHSIAS